MNRLATLLLLAVAAFEVAATDPVQFDYMMNCQGCHLPDGKGFPARNVPEIAGNLGNFLRVEGGREFLVQVPGSAHSDLDDARLAAVLNWMLVNFSADELPVDWEPYREEEVHRLRQSPLMEVIPVRNHLMGLIQARQKTKEVSP